jgi:hypothetical protein
VKARAQIRFPARVHDAELLWYDPDRWSTFIDGFGRREKIEGEWPREGARAVWDSRPGGRGRVVERVTGWASGDGQDLDVEDERLSGHQRVRFVQDGEQLAVTLELDYRLKRRAFWLIDLLFIRPAITTSLQRTLQRLAVEVKAERELQSPT